MRFQNCKFRSSSINIIKCSYDNNLRWIPQDNLLMISHHLVSLWLGEPVLTKISCLIWRHLARTSLLSCNAISRDVIQHGPLARYVKLRVAHAPGMLGTFSPSPISKESVIVSDPGLHHGTCVTHVSWCMSGWLTRGGGENGPGWYKRTWYQSAATWWTYTEGRRVSRHYLFDPGLVSIECTKSLHSSPTLVSPILTISPLPVYCSHRHGIVVLYHYTPHWCTGTEGRRSQLYTYTTS